MDIACSTKNVPLLRRLEQCAPFAGWLLVKVPVFGGFGATWQRRWVVISHRFPNPRAPRNSQLTHCVFLAYKTLANTAPSCRVWLDGARAVSCLLLPCSACGLHPTPAALLCTPEPAEATLPCLASCIAKTPLLCTCLLL
jgi:hypothetical protein